MQCDFSKFTDSMFAHTMGTPYLVKKDMDIYEADLWYHFPEVTRIFGQAHMSKTENFQNFW